MTDSPETILKRIEEIARYEGKWAGLNWTDAGWLITQLRAALPVVEASLALDTILTPLRTETVAFSNAVAAYRQFSASPEGRYDER